MRTYIYTILTITAFLSACQHESQYIALSTFKIDNSKIQNLDKVNLMYSSETPINEPALSYFIHLVGVVERTGDTLNILTTFNRGGGNGPQKNQFTLYKFDSAEGEVYFNELYNTDETLVRTLDEINKIDRVVYDKRFDLLLIIIIQLLLALLIRSNIISIIINKILKNSKTKPTNFFPIKI